MNKWAYIKQNQHQRAGGSVFYTQDLWNRPIQMECTKFKTGKKRKQNNLFTHTQDWKARLENDIKNSITRIHACGWQNILSHKAKAWRLRLCCFQRLMEMLYIRWNKIANLSIGFRIFIAFIRSPQTNHTITATQFILGKFNTMICSLLSFKTKQKSYLFIPNKSLMGT